MANLSRLEIIKTKPIGEGLNDFRDAFNLTCRDLGVSSSFDTLHQIGDEGNCQFVHRKSSLTYIGLKNLIDDLLMSLQNLPAALSSSLFVTSFGNLAPYSIPTSMLNGSCLF